MTVLELDRWHDDGGPALVEPLTLAEVRVLWADALGRAVRAAADAMRPLFDVFRQIAEAAAIGVRRFTEGLAAFRWRTDVPPSRWRDWLPSTERAVDRARRQHVDRQLRTLQRRAARRRRHAARIGRDR